MLSANQYREAEFGYTLAESKRGFKIHYAQLNLWLPQSGLRSSRSQCGSWDAVASSTEAGAVHRFEATARPLPATFAQTSTHYFGLPEAVELARALGVSAEACRVRDRGLDPRGRRRSDAWVARAVETVAASIRDEILDAAPAPP